MLGAEESWMRLVVMVVMGWTTVAVMAMVWVEVWMTRRWRLRSRRSYRLVMGGGSRIWSERKAD